ASPADFGGVAPRPRWRAPRLGEHTEVVLEELGLDDRDIARLVEAGVAGTAVADTDPKRGAE
ncbi:MAG: CoA transferase, partial [Acidimicrobiales bacterium]